MGYLDDVNTFEFGIQQDAMEKHPNALYRWYFTRTVCIMKDTAIHESSWTWIWCTLFIFAAVVASCFMFYFCFKIVYAYDDYKQNRMCVIFLFLLQALCMQNMIIWQMKYRLINKPDNSNDLIYWNKCMSKVTQRSINTQQQTNSTLKRKIRKFASNNICNSILRTLNG